MDSDTEQESIEGEVDVDKSAADWGKSKFDYYYTDYVDKDYPSKLTAKEEKLAAIEQEEALRIQKKLLSTLDHVDLQVVFDDDGEENLIDAIEKQNQSVLNHSTHPKKRKRVHFVDQKSENSDGDDDNYVEDDDNDDGEDEYNEDDSEEGEDEVDELEGGDNPQGETRQRRPINIAIKKNRGLTPYKKKEYRNPRVKHKLKYKKALSKRRRIVREVMPQLHRYSGEATGIKTSTVKSIKLN